MDQAWQSINGFAVSFTSSFDQLKIKFYTEIIPSSTGPLFQNEGSCSAFNMEIIFHSHANKTHFHKKGCAPSLILKVRGFGIRKWPIVSVPSGGPVDRGVNF